MMKTARTDKQCARPTVRAALGWAQNLLPADTDSARNREIDRLLAHILEIPSYDLRLSPDRPVNVQQLERFRRMWARRLEGEPLEYLLGRTEFMSLSFRVLPGVFIPRPETECLVEAVIESGRAGGAWIDVGTGSGIVAVTLAIYVSDITVYASDVSERALGVAAGNALLHGVSERVRFVRGDLLRHFRGSAWADGIISNPPYVSADEMGELPPDVKDHEPREALFGGRDGLDVVRSLIAQAPAVVKSGGLIALEIGATQGDRVGSLLEADPAWTGVRIEKDLAHRDRIALAIRSNQ